MSQFKTFLDFYNRLLFEPMQTLCKFGDLRPLSHSFFGAFGTVKLSPEIYVYINKYKIITCIIRTEIHRGIAAVKQHC
jgi:hypothetical protein